MEIDLYSDGHFSSARFYWLPLCGPNGSTRIGGSQYRVEEAAASLGASRLQTIVRIVIPELIPAALTGFTVAFARALGEYGSVVFISGNMPMKTEIVPLLIMMELDQFHYTEATVIAVMMLVVSLILLFLINGLQRWGKLRGEFA